MLENKYNMDEKCFLIDRNKRRHAIVGKGCKNLHLLKYNLQDIVIIIVFRCADETKLTLFINFRASNYGTGHLFLDEKEGNATLS